MKFFERLSRQYSIAMSCNLCFADGKLSHPGNHLPQPRHVGKRYYRARLRVLILGLNPGAAARVDMNANCQAESILEKYKDERATLQDVFKCQELEMPNWGKPRGRFVDFYTQATGLSLDELAFANIALCATQGNLYPDHMLKQCFDKHTKKVLSTLEPDVILLSGTKVHGFRKRIGNDLPCALLIETLHYAHRKSHSANAAEIARIGNIIGSVSHHGGA